jgi:hypothetical protein
VASGRTGLGIRAPRAAAQARDAFDPVGGIHRRRTRGLHYQACIEDEDIDYRAARNLDQI